MDYVLAVERESETCKVCVLIPELVVRHWWEGMLHNRRSDLLKVMLLMRGNRRIVVINIPWYLENELIAPRLRKVSCYLSGKAAVPWRMAPMHGPFRDRAAEAFSRWTGFVKGGGRG